MATQLLREWTSFQQFPAATQEKLVNLLGKLKNQVQSPPLPPPPPPSLIQLIGNSLCISFLLPGWVILSFFDYVYYGNLSSDAVMLLVIFFVGCEYIDYPCNGERWGGKIFHS